MLTIVCENVYIIMHLYCMKYLMLHRPAPQQCLVSSWLSTVDLHAAIVSGKIVFAFALLETGQTSRVKFHPNPTNS